MIVEVKSGSAKGDRHLTEETAEPGRGTEGKLATMQNSPAPTEALNVVLDTNVVLDLFVWNNPIADPLRSAIKRGDFLCLSDSECLTELSRVLTYPKLGLDLDTQAVIAREYAAYCRLVEAEMNTSSRSPKLPRCRDRDDQKFLELAVRANADLLLTRDNALLRMAKRFRTIAPRLTIQTPTRALEAHPQSMGN